jgi:hypothetical protein
MNRAYIVFLQRDWPLFGPDCRLHWTLYQTILFNKLIASLCIGSISTRRLTDLDLFLESETIAWGEKHQEVNNYIRYDTDSDTEFSTSLYWQRQLNLRSLTIKF